MTENLKKFSINDLRFVETEESDSYAVAEIWLLGASNNSHRNPISEEVLMKYGESAKGAWVVFDYSDYTKDATTHTENQKIAGIIPFDSKIRFERNQKGILFIVADAIISKIYNPEVWEMFKKNNYREVSCEFLANEDEELPNGDKPIISFDIKGVTILGSGIHASCPDAHMKMIQFAENKAIEYYEIHNNPLKQFAEKRREKMAEKEAKYVSHPINESKDSVYDGEWDGNKAKQDLIKEEKYDSLAPKVCLRLEDGWKDREVTKLGYPVMTLHNGEWVYSKRGLASALGYAKAEKDEEIVNKVESIYKKLDLDKEDDKEGKEKEMAEKKEKEFEIEGREAWGDVIKKVEDHEGDGVYVQSVEKDHIIFKKKGVVYRVEADVKVGKDDKTVSADIKWDTLKKDKVQKDFSDDKLDKDKDEEEMDEDISKEEKKAEKSAKKYSLDVNADNGAMLAMLEKETGENKELAKEVTGLWDDLHKDKDLNVIMERYAKVAKERDELKKFKEEVMAEKSMAEFNKTMANVKEDMSTETYAKLYEEGKEIKDFEKMQAFSVKVKAFAYEENKSKSKEESESKSFKFASGNYFNDKKTPNVFTKINNK